MEKIIGELKEVIKALESCCENLHKEVVHGISEAKGEKWTDLDKHVENLSLKLGYTEKIDYDHAMRLGKFKAGQIRPILIKLVRQRDKFDILSRTRNLRGTTIGVEEDFTLAERQRKSLLRQKSVEIKGSDKRIRSKIFVKKNELQISYPDKPVELYYVDDSNNVKLKVQISRGLEDPDAMQ